MGLNVALWSCKRSPPASNTGKIVPGAGFGVTLIKKILYMSKISIAFLRVLFFSFILMVCRSVAADQYLEYKGVIIGEYAVWPDAYVYGVARVSGGASCYFEIFNKNLFELLERTAMSAKAVDVTCQKVRPVSIEGEKFYLKLIKIHPVRSES